MAASVEEEIDRLYGLPLEEFTSARETLARRLRGEGRKEEAAGVSALRKPVLAAWVVNRLARAERKEVRALIAAAEGIRAGRRGADDRFREGLDRLAAAARQVLAEAGRDPTDAVVREAVTTLRSAAAADHESLAAGRLSQTVEATGFAAMAGAVVRPPQSASAAPKREARRDAGARIEKARAALTAAQDDARVLRREADAAERAARTARAKADDAERRVERAEAAVTAARGRALG
jgi:hypothetical protein